MSRKRSIDSGELSSEAFAQAQISQLEAQHPWLQSQAQRETLLDFQSRLFPNYVTPAHLKPLTDVLERISNGESLQVVCSSPPRGGKTEILLSSLSWLLHRHPDWELGYASYNATQARSKSRRGLQMAERSGLRLATHAVTDWRTPHGGGVIARGVGEGVTGQGLDVTFVDDPHKDRAEAESKLKRDRVWDWFNDALYTRRNPSSAKAKRPQSVIVNAARWHPDDLIGRLIARPEKDWIHINIPAVTDWGQSYWPEVWPIDKLRKIESQLGAYSWASLYQGSPRPRGGAIFGDPYTWTLLPKVYREGLGLDLAYSERTSADYSVIVVMLIDPDGFCYIVDVVRVQKRAPDFIEIIKKHKERWPRARARWYAAGPEIGFKDFIDSKLGWLEIIQATADKFIRAQPVAAAWNAQRVFVPAESEHYPWVQLFLDELLNFTGVEDTHDDQVDATAAAFDLLGAPISYKSAPSSPRRWS